MVEREPYFRLCLSEVCACNPKRACHCNVLTAFARHCAQEGALVHWRNQTFCREFFFLQSCLIEAGCSNHVHAHIHIYFHFCVVYLKCKIIQIKSCEFSYVSIIEVYSYWLIWPPISIELLLLVCASVCPPVLLSPSTQRSSAQEDSCTRSVVGLVAAHALTARTATVKLRVIQASRLVSQVASAHQGWCWTTRASVSPSPCVPVCKETKRTCLGQ